MHKESIILVGGGGHAKACIDVILSSNKFTIKGYIDIKETLNVKYNIPYLGDDSNISQYISSYSFLITVGQIQSPSIRVNLYNKLKALKANLPVIISSNAYVSPYASISEGTIIMHGAIVQFNAKIGVNCIINDRALIEHDASVGNHCHISTAAVLNGKVTVHDNVFVGSGSVVKNGLTISENVIIGSGSNIINNLEINSKVFGNPAK
jgi:sugar O-acyltransferase (sialic acid O-acetyltransferase NeuD family)